MARARLIYRWESGDELFCEVKCATSYPDALNQAKNEAVDMLRQSLKITQALDAEAGE